MQDFHSLLTEKLEQDKQEYDQYCHDLKKNLQNVQRDFQNFLSEWKQFEENVLNITKNITVPKFLKMKQLLDKQLKYRMRLEQQFQKTLTEKQNVDVELILYQTKTEMQYQDLMNLLLKQEQALNQFQREIMVLIPQILENRNQHQEFSNESKSNILQMMELLKRVNHRLQNQDLNTEKLKTQIQDQSEKIVELTEKMQQQLYKVMWCLGTFGVLNILLQIKHFI